MFSRRGRPDGAAAVEFALVSSILFLVLFGIIQYGLYFSDSLSTRQGVREGARQAVVGNYTAACGSATTDYARIKCNTKKAISPLAGTSNTYVKLLLRQKGTTPGWVKGNALVVCAMVKNGGLLGIVPMPNNGFTTSTTEMSIEQAATAPTGDPTSTAATTGGSDAAPSGITWGWCT